LQRTPWYKEKIRTHPRKSSALSSTLTPPDHRRSPAVTSIRLVEELQIFGSAASAHAVTSQRFDSVERTSTIPSTRRKEEAIRHRQRTPRRPEESSATAEDISSPEENPHIGKSCRLPFARKTQTANKQKPNLQDEAGADLASSPSPPQAPYPSWRSRNISPPTRTAAGNLIRRQSGRIATPGARSSTRSNAGEVNEDLDTILSSLFTAARRFLDPPPSPAPIRPPETEGTGGITARNASPPLFALLPCSKEIRTRSGHLPCLQ